MRIPVTQQFIQTQTAQSLVSQYSRRAIFGTAALLCTYNVFEYFAKKRHINQKFHSMQRQYNECQESTKDTVKIYCGYETELSYSIDFDDGEINICVPEHKAWFSEFGLDKEELKQVEQLLSEGKVFFHRTPFTLFLALGDMQLAPAVSTMDNATDNNYGASVMNSERSIRYDMIMHAIPDVEVMKSSMGFESQLSVLAHLLTAGVAVYMVPRAWRQVTQKYSEVLGQQLMGHGDAFKAWNRYAVRVAVPGALAAAGVQFAIDMYPWLKSQALMSNLPMNSTNPQVLAAIVILAKTFGFLLRYAFIYFVAVRMGARFAVQNMTKRLAQAQV